MADEDLRQAVADFLDSPMDTSGWALSNLIRIYDALPPVGDPGPIETEEVP